MTDRSPVPVYRQDAIPPAGGLTPAKREDVELSIRLALSLGDDGRPVRRRVRENPELAEASLKSLAARIYRRLEQSNYRIFQGPPAVTHGIGMHGPQGKKP